jgi:DNA-binding winged helix-turn-helix (wHTH) protein
MDGIGSAPAVDFVITPSTPQMIRELLCGQAPELIAPALYARRGRTVVVAGNPCDEIMEIAAQRHDLAYLVVAESGVDGIDDPRVDDVIFQPVSRTELELRALRVFTRKQPHSTPSSAEPVLTDRGIARGEIEVPLSVIESHIVTALLEAGGGVLPRRDLARVAGAMSAAESRTIDTHVYRLRRKLAPIEGIRIETVRQRGFRLSVRSAPDGGEELVVGR